jgi:hypothetical protein
MDITTLKKKTPTTGWFTFDKSGVELELLYISPADYNDRLKRCTEIVNGRERVSDELLLEDLASTIQTWRGMTLGKIEELIDIDITEEQRSQSVPCTPGNKIALLKDAWLFRQFVDQKTMALADFVALRRELERKNSSSSPSGGSTPAK